MTPSATVDASRACAALDTPTPTRTGRSVTAFSRRARSTAVAASELRSPVTPSRPTE